MVRGARFVLGAAAQPEFLVWRVDDSGRAVRRLDGDRGGEEDHGDHELDG